MLEIFGYVFIMAFYMSAIILGCYAVVWVVCKFIDSRRR